MQFLANIGGWGDSLYYLVVPFLFVLTIVVFFHELGHFLVARWCGIRVQVFSIGFGRELLGFTDRHGTRWKRAAVVAAGPIANFLLAIVIFAGIAMWYGTQGTTPRVDEVVPNSPAAAAGFQPGDLVLSIDGKPVQTFSDMQHIVSASAGRPLEFEVERGGRRIQLRPTLAEDKSVFGGACQIGVLGVKGIPSSGDIKTQKFGPVAAVGLGVHGSWTIIEGTFKYLCRMVIGLESADQLGGPIGIAVMSSEAARLGFDVLIRWAAAISVSIGLLNLFPIPLLDGGHLLFYGFEAARGRPLSDRAQEVGFRIGFAIVLMLMVFATYKDIGRIVHKFLS